jgi:hypothetical protein
VKAFTRGDAGLAVLRVQRQVHDPAQQVVLESILWISLGRKVMKSKVLFGEKLLLKFL